MNRLKSLKLSYSILLLSFALLVACGSTKDVKEQSTSSNKSNKSGKIVSYKNMPSLAMGDFITKDETFSHINGNLARLRAMLCGVFIQYQLQDTLEGYKTWLVNDGQDSVMLYQFPVGDYNKVGYWLYSAQIMTSLPDAPIFASFIKLEEINRDTVKAYYYEVPEDFDASLNHLLKDPQAAFAEVDLDELEPSKVGELVTFKRKSPLFYVGLNILNAVEDNPESKVGFMADLYVVKPKLVQFGSMYYDREKKRLGSTRYLVRLNKLAMMKADKPK